jgi:hypothetical protein
VSARESPSPRTPLLSTLVAAAQTSVGKVSSQKLCMSEKLFLSERGIKLDLRRFHLVGAKSNAKRSGAKR